MMSSRRSFVCGGAAVAMGAAAGTAPRAGAQSAPALKVMTFPGATNFPIFAAQHKGLFTKHG